MNSFFLLFFLFSLLKFQHPIGTNAHNNAFLPDSFIPERIVSSFFSHHFLINTTRKGGGINQWIFEKVRRLLLAVHKSQKSHYRIFGKSVLLFPVRLLLNFICMCEEFLICFARSYRAIMIAHCSLKFWGRTGFDGYRSLWAACCALPACAKNKPEPTNNNNAYALAA